MCTCAGPVTILNWSFPRKDLSRSAQAYQLALALREEVDDLQKAGCRVIQVGGYTPSRPDTFCEYFRFEAATFNCKVVCRVSHHSAVVS